MVSYKISGKYDYDNAQDTLEDNVDGGQDSSDSETSPTTSRDKNRINQVYPIEKCIFWEEFAKISYFFKSSISIIKIFLQI